MRYAFIEAEKANEDVAWMCERLGVSASGFYAWRKRAPSTRARKDEQLKVRIKASFEASRRTYGSPRVLEDLREEGESVGRSATPRLRSRAAASLARCAHENVSRLGRIGARACSQDLSSKANNQSRI